MAVLGRRKSGTHVSVSARRAGGWPKRGLVGVVADSAVRQRRAVVPKSPGKTCSGVSHAMSPSKRADSWMVCSARASVVQ